MSKNTVSRMMMNRSRKIEKRKAEWFKGGNGKWYKGDGSGVEVRGENVGGKGMGMPEIVGIDWSSEWIEKRKGEIREEVEKEWREKGNEGESGVEGEVEKRLGEEMRKMEESVKGKIGEGNGSRV